jgi:hypothetical protein
MKSTKFLRTWSIVFACAAVLITAACGSIEPSPTAPSPTSPAAAPSSGPATSTAPGKLEVTVNPNPVPWSGQPITDSAGCANVPNTWFYDQVLRNSGGNTINVSDRTDYFNDREVSKRTALGIVLEPGATTSIRTRWCSSASGAQSAQTNWGATDVKTGAVLTVNGPKLTLRSR